MHISDFFCTFAAFLLQSSQHSMSQNAEILPISPTNNSGEIVLYQPDDSIRLEVRMEHETVWLNQQQLMLLFHATKQNISLHINNIFAEGELDPKATVKEYLTVQKEGQRMVSRQVKYYNLDVIISVGYRIKSVIGTRFRQWANQILKDYMLRGYTINQRLLAMEDRIDRRLSEHDRLLAEHQDKIDFFVHTSLPPAEQVFYEGEFFEARVVLEQLIQSAQHRVVIIDGYVDASTFNMLDVRANNVTATIYTGKDVKELQDKYNEQTKLLPVEVIRWNHISHDRWLIIDDSVYHCGHSLKDMGRRLSAITRMGVDAETIIKQVE